MIGKYIKFIKDIIFPVFCVECGKEGERFCDSCFKKNIPQPVLCCPACRKGNDGSLCLGCREYFSLDGVQAMFEYKEEKSLTALIGDFKYHYARDINLVWKRIGNVFFTSHFPEFLKSDLIWTVIPVPLYPKRERERGYNQAELIAQIVFENINNIYPNKTEISNKIIRRSRQTLQQAKLTKEERAKNVSGAFALMAEKIPENIILVDDVFTSGVTLFECARLLKEKGAHRVWAVTLARGLYS